MRIRLGHSPYIANKVAIDLLNSGCVELKMGVEPVKIAVRSILDKDIKNEMALEHQVEEKLAENEDNIEFIGADHKTLFWMVKKRIAKDFDVILDYNERYNDIAHKILDIFWDEDLADYSVNENKIKNIIFKSIKDYVDNFDKIEDLVFEKISNYKRKLIPNTEEFELVFQKLYEEELKKRGML